MLSLTSGRSMLPTRLAQASDVRSVHSIRAAHILLPIPSYVPPADAVSAPGTTKTRETAASAVDHFHIQLPSSATAGVDFSVTITAEDNLDNVQIDFNDTITLTTNGGLIGPKFITPTNGIWTGVISMTLAGASRPVTATHDITANVASLTINTGPASSITVAPSSRSIIAGTNITYTSVATDAFGNGLGNVTGSTAFSINPASGGTFAGNAVTPTLAGNWTVTGTLGSASGNALVTVNPSTPFTLTLSPATAVISAGIPIAYTAIATDTYGNLIGNVTPSTAFTISPGSGGTFVGNTITPTIAGSYTVTGTKGSAVGTAALSVTPAAPATLTLSPATAVISAGVPIAYTAIATDTFGNSIGNVTPSTGFTIHPSPGAAFSGNSITPIISGTYIVTGTNGSAKNTAALSVTPTAYDHLVIESAANGTGTPIDAYTMTLYDTLTLYALRYDQYNNLIGNSSATWESSGIVSSGTLLPATGASTTFTPAAVVSGTGTITATSDTFSDATGLITVLAPKIVITKVDNSDPVSAGTGLGYTIIYTNVGTTAAQFVTVTETYDPNVSFVGAVPSPDPDTGNTRWTRLSLNPGQSAQIQVFTQVGGSLPVGTMLTNTVEATASRIGTSVYTETTAVDVLPDLSVGKVQLSPSGSSVRVNDTIVYQLIYTNTGTAVLHNVIVTETYDSSVDFVTAVPAPEPGTNNRRWNIPGTLGAGQSGTIAVTVKVKAPLDDATPLINVVSADSDETTPSSFQLPPITINTPELALSKHASSSSVQANALLTYTLRYTNSGHTYASSVVITDLLPSDVTFLGATPNPSQQNGSLLTWNLGQVVTQSQGTITVRVRVNNNLPNNTSITNTSRISATDAVAATAQRSTLVLSAPSVQLTKSDGKTSVVAGQRITYTLSYTNSGNSPAQNVIITDRIPSNTTYNSCASTVPCTESGGVVTFTVDTLNASSNANATVVVTVNNPLPAGLRWITNTAGIHTTTEGDPTGDNFTQDVDNIATVPVLVTSVTFDTKTPWPTKIITYTIRYTNTSAMHTTGVVLTATRAPSATFLGGSPGWDHEGGGNYTLEVGNLNAGISGTKTFVIQLPPVFDSLPAIYNDFGIHDDGPGGLPIAFHHQPTQLGIPDLIIENVVTSPSPMGFGVTLTIRNIGTGIACNPGTGGCTGYYVDAFLPPLPAPESANFSGYGQLFTVVSALAPGASVQVSINNITFNSGSDTTVYFKVDNYKCEDGGCSPPSATHGLVPESNEGNNVYGPFNPVNYGAYLPVIFHP